MHLVNGKKYMAQLRLSFGEGFATNAQVVDKLKSAGFADVNVSGAGRNRTATGTWTGPTEDVALPSEVSTVVLLG